MKHLLALEITDQKIRYIFFGKKGSETVAQRSGSIGHIVNAFQKGLLSRAISEILDKEKLEVSRVFLTISRRDTVIHQLILPRMPKSELEEVIPGEIEKIPLFFDKEFQYIYQTYDHSSEKIRVVFAAIKESFLEYLMEEISKTKIKFSDIEISPLNLIGIIATFSSVKEDQALIVVDERTTHFIVFNKNEYKFIYSTHTGTQDVFFSGTTQANTHSLSVLTDELKRVNKSYLMENKKEPFTKMLLVWDNEVAPSLNTELAKQLNVEIEELPLEKISGVRLGVLDAKQNPINVLCATPVIYSEKNLKPKFPFSHFFKEAQAHTDTFKQAAIASVVFMAATGLIFSGVMNTFYKKSEENNKKAEVLAIDIEKLTKESQKLFAEKEKYMAIRNQLLEQATYVNLLNRMSWSEVLAEVSSKLPEEMGLTSFKVSESGQVNYNGEAFKMESVSEMIRKVDVSELINSGRFSFLKEKLVEKQKIFTFGVLANLKLQSIQDKQAKESNEKK